MLAVTVFGALLASEPLFEILPADRTCVPYHLRDSVTVAEWQKLDEYSIKLQWQHERQLRQLEWREKKWREGTRRLYESNRKLGIPTPPDPEEPTESKFFPRKKE